MKFLHQCHALRSNRITDRQTKLKIYITPYQGGQKTGVCIQWYSMSLEVRYSVSLINNSKTVSSLSVRADDVSTHLLYRNTLDIHCKHTASHLHVEVCTWLVFSVIDSRYSMTSSLSVSVFTSNELPAYPHHNKYLCMS